jgi:hypothetical protein
MEFDPEGWKNEYPNPAFSRATERDNAWMARILARFDRDDVDELVGLGQFTKAEHAEYLADVLEERLELILERYLLRLSPLADLVVYEGNHLCAVDLARRRLLREPEVFQYSATWHASGADQSLSVETGEDGLLCMKLPPVAAAEGAAPDAPERYVVVTIANGVARYPLRAYFYDLGAKGGYRLVGIERRQEP